MHSESWLLWAGAAWQWSVGGGPFGQRRATAALPSTTWPQWMYGPILTLVLLLCEPLLHHGTTTGQRKATLNYTLSFVPHTSFRAVWPNFGLLLCAVPTAIYALWMHAERQATDGLDSGHTTSNLELAYRFAFGFGLSLVVDAVMNGALGRATRTLSHCARRLLGIACVIVSIGIAQTLVDISIGRSHGSDLSFGSVLLVWNVVYRVAVTRVVPGNFSLGESGLVFSLVALLTDDMLRWTVRVYRDANDSALVTTQHAVDRWMVYHLTQALLLGMLLIGLVTMPVLQLHRKRVLTGLVPKRTWFGIASGLTHWTSWTFYGGLAAVVLLVIRPWMLLVMHHVAADSVPDPFLWTWWFVVKSPERMAVVGWWVLCLCAMVLALRGTVSGTITTVPTSDLLSSDASPSTRSTQRKVRSRVTTPIGSSVAPTMRRPPAVELDRRRKFFHWMAVAMFLPGIAIVPLLTSLAFALTASLFILFEYVRVFRVEVPFMAVEELDAFVVAFTEKPKGVVARSTSSAVSPINRSWDLGPAVLSHIYLLLACAVPLWMEQLTCGFGSDDGGNESATYSDRPLRLATATAGLITIGMGDAVASTVGQRFGRIRWLPQSACNRKTVEGSLGGWLAMLIGWIAVGALVGGVTVDDGGQWIRAISIVSLGTALLEGLSLQNDNLLVPLLAAAMLLSAELA